MKRPLSKSQIICIVLLWGLLMYIVLTSATKIDGVVIVNLSIASALVWIPVIKSIKKMKK